MAETPTLPTNREGSGTHGTPSEKAALLGAGVVQQDYVVFVAGGEHADGLGVGRPVKRANAVGLQIRKLMAGRSVERLQPQVLDAVLADRIDESLAVGSKAWSVIGNAQIWLKEPRLRLRAGIERHQDYLRSFIVAAKNINHINQSFSVR